MSQNKPNQAPNGANKLTLPDPEVIPATSRRAHVESRRRTFTASYKLRILTEAERCNQPGQVGALLRREGLYASHLHTWRQERSAGLTPKRRGRRVDEQAREIVALRQENDRLKTQLHQAELIMAAQKKLAQALEQTVTASPCGNSR